MATPIQQLLSRSIFATDGTTTVWDFSFSGGYLDRTHIKAFVLTPEGGQTNLVLNYDTQLIGPYQLLISPALSEGGELHIYRDTPKNLPLVDFTDGAVNSEIALDTNAKQAVFIAAESTDLVSLVRPVDLAVSVATSVAAAEAASASSASASAAAVAAGVARDEAVAASLAPTTDDLVNTAPSGLWSTVRGFITYLTGAAGSAVVGFIQSGIGAVARTLQAKAREPLTVTDFGADPTGTTVCTAAMQTAMTRAVEQNRPLEFIQGTYLKDAELVIPNGLAVFCKGTAIIKNTVGGIKGFTTNATGSTRYYISVEGLMAQCPAGTAGTVAWDLVNVTDSHLERFGCVSDNGTDGFVTGVNIEALPTGAAWRNTIRDIRVRTKTDAAAIGLRVHGTGGNSGNMNRFTDGYVKVDGGISAQILGDNNKLDGVNFEGSSTIGVDFVSNGLTVGNTVTACRFEGNTEGIRFGASTESNIEFSNFFTSGMPTKVNDIGGRNWSLSASQLFAMLINRGRFEAVNAVDGTKGLFTANAGASTDVCFDSRAQGDTNGKFITRKNGAIEWGSGSAATDVSLRRTSTAQLSLTSGSFNSMRLADGVTAPGTVSGIATIYVDAADGDLKIKFGDGTVKTIVTDT